MVLGEVQNLQLVLLLQRDQHLRYRVPLLLEVLLPRLLNVRDRDLKFLHRLCQILLSLVLLSLHELELLVPKNLVSLMIRFYFFLLLLQLLNSFSQHLNIIIAEFGLRLFVRRRRSELL